MKYNIVVEETMQTVIPVEAENIEQAFEIARKRDCNFKIEECSMYQDIFDRRCLIADEYCEPISEYRQF